jgi:hypothetical protein
MKPELVVVLAQSPLDEETLDAQENNAEDFEYLVNNPIIVS